MPVQDGTNALLNGLIWSGWSCIRAAWRDRVDNSPDRAAGARTTELEAALWPQERRNGPAWALGVRGILPQRYGPCSSAIVALATTYDAGSSCAQTPAPCSRP